MEVKVSKRKLAALAKDALLNATTPVVPLASNDTTSAELAVPSTPVLPVVSAMTIALESPQVTVQPIEVAESFSTTSQPAVEEPTAPANDEQNGTLTTMPTLTADANEITTPVTPLPLDAADAGAVTPTMAGAVVAGIGQTPLTPLSAIKERKRRIIVDDDDESPTFNPMSRGSKRARRGRGRKGRNNNQRRSQLLMSPEKAREAGIFTTPDGKVCIIIQHTYRHIYVYSLPYYIIQ